MPTDVLEKDSAVLTEKDEEMLLEINSDLAYLFDKAYQLRRSLVPAGEKNASVENIVAWNKERLKWLRSDYNPVALLAAFIPERYAAYPEKVEDYFNMAKYADSRRKEYLKQFRNVLHESRDALADAIIQINNQIKQLEKSLEKSEGKWGEIYQSAEQLIVKEAQVRESVMPRWIDKEGMKKLAQDTWKHLNDRNTPDVVKLVWFPEDDDCKNILQMYRKSLKSLAEGRGSEKQFRQIEQIVVSLVERKKKKFASDFAHYLD